jgi:DNA end-binding protein Ku
VLALIERKAAGEELASPPPADEPAAAPDLMAALEASLAAVRSPEGAKPAKSSKQPPSSSGKPGKPVKPARPAKTASEPSKTR